VRFAGSEAKAIALPMLRLKHDLAPGHAVFGELIEPCGSDILVRQSGRSGTASEEAAEPKLSRAGGGGADLFVGVAPPATRNADR
jgi:hypothetical protein